MEEEREAGTGKKREKRERRIVRREKGRQWDVRRDGREGVKKKKHGRGGRTGTEDVGR